MFYLSCPETGSESWTFRSSLQSYCNVTEPLPRVRDGQVAHLTDAECGSKEDFLLWDWLRHASLNSPVLPSARCCLCHLLSSPVYHSPGRRPVCTQFYLTSLSSFYHRKPAEVIAVHQVASPASGHTSAYFLIAFQRQRDRDRELLSRLSSRGRESLTLYCPSIACSLKFEFVKINNIPMLPDYTVSLLYRVTCESQIRKIYNITTIIPRFILSVCARVYVCVLIEIFRTTVH